MQVRTRDRTPAPACDPVCGLKPLMMDGVSVAGRAGAQCVDKVETHIHAAALAHHTVAAWVHGTAQQNRGDIVELKYLARFRLDVMHRDGPAHAALGNMAQDRMKDRLAFPILCGILDRLRQLGSASFALLAVILSEALTLPAHKGKMLFQL